MPYAREARMRSERTFVCALLLTHRPPGWSTVPGVRRDRRERTSRAPDRRTPAEQASDRRSPAFYATRADVGWLVALLTLMDTLVKLAIKAY